MENTIAISYLNDFVFCPVSIYFHNLDAETDKISYQSSSQLNGTAAHKKIDDGEYSDRRDILQAVSIYSEKYNLQGKIDSFDAKEGILTERKRTIKKIYDGYVFQLYAQYYCLEEMGYKVNAIRLYSMTDNKVYKIDLPAENKTMKLKFENMINDIRKFDIDNFDQNSKEKCFNCIYEELCSYSKAGEIL